jgi:predicted lipid-binding transport protein (Tim44 family)
VRSKPPDRVLSFQCPACGAPYQRSDAGACAHCGKQVEDGKFDWTITRVQQHAQDARPPALGGDAPEVGTTMPSVIDEELKEQRAVLLGEDPAATDANILARLQTIYTALNDAWTARDLRPVRPHVSDALYNYLAYWIDAYRNQGLTNVLEDMSISRAQVVKISRDRHFDAVTVRFWATGLDYTIDRNGRRFGGSSKRKRAYSEYWTLIRGATVRGAPRDPATCPSCGAALDRVSMAGNCEHCGAHLTRGEFDWVLSKIEQDESYSG